MAKDAPCQKNVPAQEKYPQEIGGCKDEYTTAKPITTMGGPRVNPLPPGFQGEKWNGAFCYDNKTKNKYTE
jgi:hypothetical protein